MNANNNAKREIITINDSSSEVLGRAENSAMEVAKFLLSLDPKNSQGLREYFTLRPISLGEEYESLPIEGNFRLNKLLHMCQIFHGIEYGKPLFRERMEAFKHGAIVYSVRMNFIQLWFLPIGDLVTNINKKTQHFIHSVYNYFHDNYKNDNEALYNFSHQDPAWGLGLEREGGLMPLNRKLITYYKKFFDDTLEEIKENRT